MADSKTADDAKLLEELLEAHVLDLPHIRKIVRRIRIRAARASPFVWTRARNGMIRSIRR